MSQARTEGGNLKPGDYPLGSTQSRAAARSVLANRRASLERREIILCCSPNEGSAPHATEWGVNVKEQTAGRVVAIPEGMPLAEGLSMLGGYSEAELEIIADMHPGPVVSGDLLALRRH